MSTIDSSNSERLDHVVALRRTFHRHPELAFEEQETAARIMAELEDLGIPYAYDGVGSGVIGRLEAGATDRPVVALRAEMDALPGEEMTGLPFASEEPNRMHTCGHDAHMAMVLGAARALADDPPDGTVVFVFQPAEESGGGSREVLASGHVDDVEAIFALHVTRHYETGDVMIKDGFVTAQSDGFEVDIRGKGGHGARPHEAVDAIVIASAFINTIQTLVSRRVDPLHPSVVTIGKIVAGSAPNVIAEQAHLEGTIRTTRESIRGKIHQGLRGIAQALADSHDAVVDLQISKGYPPVENSARQTQWARESAADVLGESHLHEAEHPSMGAEDFSYFLRELPGAYVRLGARPPGGQYLPLHSPSFTIDEDALAIGTTYLEGLARTAIRKFAEQR